MSNTITAMRKSVVMLFSFAIIATLLTVINVGVNESGNTSLSTITNAQAFSIGYDTGGVVPPKAKPSEACGPGCTPIKSSGPAVITAKTNPYTKSIYYGCTKVDGAGNCTVSNVVTRDAQIRNEKCIMTFTSGWGTRIRAFGGPGAVQWLKSSGLGGIWQPAGDEEHMFTWLTGYDIGWFPYPTDWSQANTFSYVNRGNEEYSYGEYSFRCSKVLDITNYFHDHSVTCAPRNDGRPFPYAVGYTVTYQDSQAGRTIMGGRSMDWSVVAESCVYVNPGTPPPKVLDKTETCYWNVGHQGFYSQNKAAINSGGTLTSNQPKLTGFIPTKPWVSGADSNASLNNCWHEFSMNVNLELNDGWAYYRLQGSANYQDYATYVWDTAWTGGVKKIANIKAVGGVGTQVKKAFGTHGCSNPAYQAAPSYAALPTVSFKASDCERKTTWDCKIPTNPRINGVDNAIEVMRDGTYIPVQLGGAVITGSGVRDINTHATASVAENNLSYMVKVKNNSSPFNGTNPNDSKQYFELWKNDKATETQWNTWLSHPNANKISFLNFYWSSDTGATWNMEYQARINVAQFDVPFQTSTTGVSGSQWRTDTNIDCDGVKTSNSVTVLRSVSSEG